MGLTVEVAPPRQGRHVERPSVRLFGCYCLGPTRAMHRRQVEAIPNASVSYCLESGMRASGVRTR